MFFYKDGTEPHGYVLMPPIMETVTVPRKAPAVPGQWQHELGCSERPAQGDGLCANGDKAIGAFRGVHVSPSQGSVADSS